MFEQNFFSEYKTLFLVIHVLFVVLGMGSALVSDFFFTFYGRDKVISKTESQSLDLLSNIVWISLVFIIASGFALFFSDTVKYLASDKFISKMFIMIVLLINGLFLSKFIAPHFEDRGILKFKTKRPIRQIAFFCGAVSLVSWVSVCVLGLLKSIPVHFSLFLIIYLLTVSFAGFVALFVEWFTFSSSR